MPSKLAHDSILSNRNRGVKPKENPKLNGAIWIEGYPLMDREAWSKVTVPLRK
jgi:hypothetical protein